MLLGHGRKHALSPLDPGVWRHAPLPLRQQQQDAGPFNLNLRSAFSFDFPTASFVGSRWCCLRSGPVPVSGAGGLLLKTRMASAPQGRCPWT